MLSQAMKIRIARPSYNLALAERFYTQGLGLKVLYQDKNDDFASLLMLGLPSAPWHLELTKPRQPIQPTPTEEDLLVFYLGQPPSSSLIQLLEKHGGKRVTASNPYWERWGVTIADPDDYRLVLCEREWRA